MAEFLEWEEQQDGKYEFDGHGIVAMIGGTVAHAEICINLTTALRNRLRGMPCRAYGAELKMEVAGAIRYPDAVVTCTRIAPDATLMTQPVVIFEVLSPSTATVAFTDKHDEYRDTPSVTRYVILRQDRMHATVFSRVEGAWSRAVIVGDGTLAMQEIGIEVPLAELYEDVVFGPA